MLRYPPDAKYPSHTVRYLSVAGLPLAVGLSRLGPHHITSARCNPPRAMRGNDRCRYDYLTLRGAHQPPSADLPSNLQRLVSQEICCYEFLRYGRAFFGPWSLAVSLCICVWIA